MNKLVQILNDGQPHDGDTLGSMLGISRAAIWKMIKKLKEQGVMIASTKGKGYQLATPLFLLDENRIKQNVDPAIIDIICFESITSTNDYLKIAPKKAKTRLLVCLSEEQTAGRGRLGRQWASPFGSNLYLSCRYSFQQDISELSGLSLVVGIALVTALRALGFYDISLKWPNDLLWQGKKLAGILIEMRAEAHGISEVIIGIGLNVNAAPDVAQTVKPVTSLREIHNKLCDRTELAVQLIRELLIDLILFEAKGWSPFNTQFAQLDYLAGKNIVMQQGNQQVAGVASGVDERGYLLLQDEKGQMRAFSSGEASVDKQSY